ncbi:MAG: hypothetical protein ABMB14_02630 [Myxococcota bacterium]
MVTWMLIFPLDRSGLASTAASAATVAERVAATAAARTHRTVAVAAIPTAAYDRAEGGAVATGVADGLAWGVGVIPVPIDRYWRAINDDAAKPAWTDLAYVELLAGQPCGPARTMFQYLDVDVLSDRWWVVEQRAVAAVAGDVGVRELSWRSVDPSGRLTPSATAWADRGAPIVSTRGAWWLTDLGDGRTLVEYVAASDAGGFVPKGVVDRFAVAGVRTTVLAMQKLAEAGPACR